HERRVLVLIVLVEILIAAAATPSRALAAGGPFLNLVVLVPVVVIIAAAAGRHLGLGGDRRDAELDAALGALADAAGVFVIDLKGGGTLGTLDAEHGADLDPKHEPIVDPVRLPACPRPTQEGDGEEGPRSCATRMGTRMHTDQTAERTPLSLP